MSETITSNGKTVRSGESFQPDPNDPAYSVVFVGIRESATGEEVVLRDRLGEFAKTIRPFADDHIVLSEN